MCKVTFELVDQRHPITFLVTAKELPAVITEWAPLATTIRVREA